MGRMKRKDKSESSGDDELRTLRRQAASFESTRRTRMKIHTTSQQPEGQYRLLLEHASEAILVAQDGYLKYFNPRVAALTGYSQKELASKPLVELIDPDDREMVMERHARLLRGEETSNVYTFRIHDKKGETKWVEINAVGFTWEGRPATLNFLTDVSDRVLAEEGLRESEQKYRRLVENINDAIYTIDPQGIITYVSSRIQEISGFTAEEVIGRPLLDCIFVDDRPFVRGRFEDILRDTTGLTECRIVSKTGEVIWIRASSKPISVEGRLVGLQGIVTNITEQRKAKEAFLERAKRLELIGAVSQKTTAILNLNELLHQAVHSIADTFHFYNVIVLLIENEDLVLKATTLGPLQPLEGRVRLKIESQGITSWVAHRGTPLLVPDVTKDPRYLASLEKMETRSEVAVPIIVQDRVIGVLDAQSAECDAFSQIDVFTLQTLADQLAIAIENARLYEQASQEISERKKAEKEKEKLIGDLQQALAKVKTLSGLIPICSSCKRIRDDRGYWNQIEAYIREHSEADFSHGFCPECMKRLYPDFCGDSTEGKSDPYGK